MSLFAGWRQSRSLRVPVHVCVMLILTISVQEAVARCTRPTKRSFADLQRVCPAARAAARKKLMELAMQGRLEAAMKDRKSLVGYLALNALGEWYIPRRISWNMIDRWVMEYAPAYVQAQQRQQLNQADAS